MDDGSDAYDEGNHPRLPTTVQADASRTIIARNRSPDLPFDQSINPYRGCEHGCVYCLSGDTPILFADGRHKPLREVEVGETIIGTARDGWYRRYVETRVLDHWSTIKPAYRITLADGTRLTASADHRFLTERGWKFVTGREQGCDRRPHLTRNNKLMGTGQFSEPPSDTEDYRRGYLCGLVRGDGHIGSYSYDRPGRAHRDIHCFRLALVDHEALQRARKYLEGFSLRTCEFEFQKAAGDSKAMRAIRTNAKVQVERIQELIDWPLAASDDWYKGFLAGIFDAEGHFGSNTLRIPNSDREIIDCLRNALNQFGFDHVLEPIERDDRKPLTIVRLTGGLAEQLRFFHLTDPAITRKRSTAGIAIKSNCDLRIARIESLGRVMPMYDISTGTGDFIANGVVSHNCFARPTHAYLDLSPGLDFETRLFYKPHAARLFLEALSRPGYRCRVVALGTNTDPYQPIEKRFGIMRGILEVCARTRHPIGITTKSSRIEKDLDLLRDLARDHLVCVSMSVTTLDKELARRLEPRASAPVRRLQTIARLSDAGIPVSVSVAPVIPVLTDPELEAIMEEAASLGARSAGYILLRLPREVKDLFKEWLRQHYPDRAEHVMSVIRQSRQGLENDAEFGRRRRGTGVFAEMIAARFRLTARRLGLDQGIPDLNTRSFRKPGAQLDLGI